MSSGWEALTCSVLGRERLSLGGGIGRRLVELAERTGSFSTGGGGVWMLALAGCVGMGSGRLGSSGTASWARGCQ